jgi:hypothetical protein
VLVVTASGSPARADQETVELRYSAPPGCPSRAAFEAEILERTPNVRLAAPARRVFAVTIEPADDGFRGTLVVDRKGADPLTAGGAGRAPPPRGGGGGGCGGGQNRPSPPTRFARRSGG